jgi:hypothetical protein
MKIDDLFYGLTDREIATAVAMEMGRRQLNGCIFMYPEKGGPAVFASSSPPGTLAGFKASDQLKLFAEVAEGAVKESTTMLPKNPEPEEGWVN